MVAKVRRGNELSKEESTYLQQRLPYVQKALEKLLAKPLAGNYIPKIALVC